MCCFSSHGRGKSQQKLKSLVLKPLTRYLPTGKNDYLSTHANTDYHQTNALKSKDFFTEVKKPSENNSSLVEKARSDCAKQNCNGLKAIIRGVICLGKQGLAFKGHQDNGDLFTTVKETSKTNAGNFRLF